MKKSMATSTLLDDMKAISVKLEKSNQRGNARGIGVESMVGESNKAQVSRNKARVLKKMSPSLDRGIQILSGMVACPEGGVRTNLQTTLGDVEGISEEKKNKLLVSLKEYFDNQLGLEDKLHDMIYKVISETGAEVEVYIPITMVDEIMGLESTGVVKADIPEDKNPIKYNDSKVAVSSNMSLLTQEPFPLAPEVGNESGKSGGRSRISRINRTAIAINDDGLSGEESVIVRHTDGGAVIPIEYNGRVIKYIGILDEMGNFVTNTDSTSFVDLMGEGGGDETKSQFEILTNEAKSGTPVNDNYRNLRKSIEDDVLAALTGKSKFNTPEEILRSLGEENVLDILTARSLAVKKTRVVMLDPEYVSYFSLINNSNGRGITIIEDNSAIILLHVTLLYAKILSELESSIPQTVASATLDENDQNSESTIKDIMGELANATVPNYEFDYGGNQGLFKSLSLMNTSVKIENADVPGMPKMDIDIERTQRDISPPSGDLLETVGKYSAQVLGISPEHVDSSYSEKFKLQVTRDNDISNRQLSRYTATVNECVTDRCRKRVAHNDSIWGELTSIIGGTNADDKLIELLATLSVRLPEQTSSKFENFSINMETISRSIEDYVKLAIPDTVIDNGERIDQDTLGTMREMVVGAVIRTYAQETDLFGGLGIDLTSMGGMADIITDELEDYGDEFKGMAKEIRKFNKKVEKATDVVEAEEEEIVEEPEVVDEPAIDEDTDETTDELPDEAGVDEYDPEADLDVEPEAEAPAEEEATDTTTDELPPELADLE